jgi:hypothetical protein
MIMVNLQSDIPGPCAADPEDAALDDWLPLEAVRDMAVSVADGMCATMGVVCREGSSEANTDTDDTKQSKLVAAPG